MPLEMGIDQENCFYRWGERKFHYTCGDGDARKEAKRAAIAFAFKVSPEEAKKEFRK